MKRTTKKTDDLAEQVANRDRSKKKEKAPPGNDSLMISTGSTLLDLAIGWERRMAGGLPAGILVEIFGPPSSGKTTLLCEIGGAVQRKGGSVLYMDPEGRLNVDYAKRMGLTIDPTDPKQYKRPRTVPEVFAPIRKWEPKPEGIVHAVVADSLAALSTDLELESGDKYGMRRAKEFSQELRQVAITIADKNFLVVCSNQLRQSQGPYGPVFKAPGGEAIGYYASVRLRVDNPTKIKKKVKINGKEVEKVVAISTEISVVKSSVGEPFNKVPVIIDLTYGIDDIRSNLVYLKALQSSDDEDKKNTIYKMGEEPLSKSLVESIRMIEENNWEKQLRKEVIGTWQEVQSAFRVERKEKVRT